MGHLSIVTKFYGAIFAMGMLAGAGAVGRGYDENPIIKLRLDEPVSVVQAHSTFHFSAEFLRGESAFNLIAVPHTLVYEDSTLTLRIQGAGGLRTLATNIGTSPPHSGRGREPTVYSVGVFVLRDYSPLSTVVKHARAIQTELLAQGFTANQRSWQSRFRANFRNAPSHLDTLDDMETAFVDSAFFAQEATAFDMTKGRLRLEATIVNGRRRWGSRTDSTDSAQSSIEVRAAREGVTMSMNDLYMEPSYSLKLNIGPTDAWMAQRVKDW